MKDQQFCSPARKSATSISLWLHLSEPTRYSPDATAKSVTGIDVPQNTMATLPASRVLIDVVASAHPQFMVAQAGASQEAPVSIVSGYVNPVWATTLEVDVSGGSVKNAHNGDCQMATTLLFIFPKPCFLSMGVNHV